MPALVLRAKDDSVEAGAVDVWQARLDCEPSTVARLARLLSADEVERAARFHFAVDRDRYVVARGTLRVLLGRYLHCDPAWPRFAYLTYGKPVLATTSNAEPLHFNVSHSHDLALYAVTRFGEVGIDVEQIRDDLPIDEIARSFFAPQEITALSRLPMRARLDRFYTSWTRKEAYSKALGQGLNLDPRRIDASTPLKPISVLFPLSVDSVIDPNYYLCDLDVGTGYAGALAVAGQPQTVRTHSLLELAY